MPPRIQVKLDARAIADFVASIVEPRDWVVREEHLVGARRALFAEAEENSPVLKMIVLDASAKPVVYGFIHDRLLLEFKCVPIRARSWRTLWFRRTVAVKYVVVSMSLRTP